MQVIKSHAVFLMNASLALMIMLFSCSSSERVKRPATQAEPKGIQNFEDMNEDFDPLTLNEDKLVLDDYETTSNPAVSDEIFAANDVFSDSVGTGYRIQIYQTTDREEAENVRRDAILRFDQDVYWVFHPPFYKVRVGDFINWYDAEKLQQLAIQKNYREAWVVRTKVDLVKARKWMSEF